MTLIFDELLLIGDNYVSNPDVFEVVSSPVINPDFEEKNT